MDQPRQPGRPLDLPLLFFLQERAQGLEQLQSGAVLRPQPPPPRPGPPPPGPEPAPPSAPAPERQFLNRLLAKLHLGDMDAGDLLLLLILFFLFYQKADEEVLIAIGLLLIL